MSAARAVITSGLDARAFPAAVIEVGRADGPIWREAFGRLTLRRAARGRRRSTRSSISRRSRKSSRRRPLAMRAVRERPARARNAGRRSTARAGAARIAPASPIRQLLDHSSGLPAHARLWEQRARPRGVRARPSLRCRSSARRARRRSTPIRIHAAGVRARRRRRRAARRSSSRRSRRTMNGDIRYLPPPEWRESHRADRSTIRGAAACCRARCTTRTPRRSAASPRTRGSSARPAPSARSRGSCSRTLHAHDRARHAGRCCATFATRSRRAGQLARARAGTRCCRRRRAARACRRRAIGHTGFTGTSLWIDPERDRLRRVADQPRAPDARERVAGRAAADAARRGHGSVASTWSGFSPER